MTIGFLMVPPEQLRFNAMDIATAAHSCPGRDTWLAGVAQNVLKGAA
jgi:hypothetical protein